MQEKKQSETDPFGRFGRGLREMSSRFSNSFFQCIALATSLAPIVFSESSLMLRVVFFFVIWWGWLVVAQLMPVIPEFSSEKYWIKSLWKSGGAKRAASCIVGAIYLPIFVSKLVYFWIAVLAVAGYYIIIFAGE